VLLGLGNKLTQAKKGEGGFFLPLFFVLVQTFYSVIASIFAVIAHEDKKMPLMAFFTANGADLFV
jgi:hypothetical protein